MTDQTRQGDGKEEKGKTIPPLVPMPGPTVPPVVPPTPSLPETDD